MIDFFIRLKESFSNNMPLYTGLFAYTVISYVFRGYAFNKFQGNNNGFIPIAGDMVCMLKIIEKFEKKFKIRYLIWTSIATIVKMFFIFIIRLIIAFIFFLPFMFFMTLVTMSRDGGDLFRFKNNDLLIITLILFIFVLSIVSLVKYYILRYKVFTYIFEKDSYMYDVRKKVLLCTFIPLAFYIWILAKENN